MVIEKSNLIVLFLVNKIIISSENSNELENTLIMYSETQFFKYIQYYTLLAHQNIGFTMKIIYYSFQFPFADNYFLNFTAGS